MEKIKRTKNFAAHLPHHLVYMNIPASKPTNNTTNIHTTHTVGIIQPGTPPTHPFKACIKAARNTGFAEGHVLRALEIRELMVKLQLFERQIVQLEGWLQGNKKLEAEKTGSEEPAAAHVFHEFVPGAPFHPPIPHSTAALPTSAIHFHANSLPEWDKPQSQSKSPNPWSGLTIRHTCRTCQQNHSFHTSIYKMSIYIHADCKHFVTYLITPKLGFLTFRFGWGDKGVAMWVRGTCVRGSVGFEGGVAGAGSGVLLRSW